jgi:pimeloyl-ACP methyl ester carboxylesterase
MRAWSDEGSPDVLIVGGLLSPPVAYRRMRQRLLERGAARVDIAPVLVMDWARAGLSDFGALQGKVVRAIERTFRRAHGRPILVVGHSGGGLLARLAMCDAPYRGRVGGAAPMVGCLVTLGSPHGLHHAPLPGSHEGVRLAAFLAEHAAGARHAPRTAYLTVASDAVAPRPPGQQDTPRGPIGRMQRAFFQRITGPTLAPGSDGLVSQALAHLDGAQQVTLHDVSHGVIGSPWYGDAEVIDRWWPQALGAWAAARHARSDPRGLLLSTPVDVAPDGGPSSRY